MSGIQQSDRLPLLAAAAVMVLANGIVFMLQATIYLSILGAPAAIATFGVVRYVTHGSAYPEGFSG
jgi:hypothetical protein